MKILYKTVVTLVLLTTVIYSNAVNNASKSVVRIIVEMKGGFSTGTAFCVNSDGYYVTNHHVISDAIGGQFKATALDINHKKYLVDILWYSKDKDLAILKIILAIAFVLSFNTKDEALPSVKILEFENCSESLLLSSSTILNSLFLNDNTVASVTATVLLPTPPFVFATM